MSGHTDDIGWAVLQSEWYEGESPEECVWAAFTLFDTKDQAISFIENVIRKEWLENVVVRDESGAELVGNLADFKGFADGDTEGCLDVYYSPNGDEAWFVRGGKAFRISAVKVRGKGIRVSI